MPTKKTLVKLSGGLVIIGLVFVISVILHVRTAESDNIHNTDSSPQSEAIIILGASLKKDGSPSDALRDRLTVGAELYKLNKAPQIIVTGDDGQNRMDEVTIMKQTLIDLGIPQEAIIKDNHGYRTYESCKRAKKVFNINEAILITQKFHLVRALYICNELGVHSTGVTSDLQDYQKITQFIIRDWLASFKAWIDINLLEPEPPVHYRNNN